MVRSRILHATVFAVTTVAIWQSFAPAARGIVFYDTVGSGHNTSSPTGGYADSGWQYEGYFGGYLGTMISPSHFLTARHIGVASSTFSYDTLFSGAPTVNYTIDTAANGGTGYYDIAGTDFRIFQITGGTFANYAPLYTGSGDVGSEFVVIGRGGPKGAAVNLAPDGPKGWQLGGSDGVARWGRNTFDSVAGSGVGNLLVADFDAAAGQDEAHFSVGDSGGAAFVNDGGVWKLAGINYAIDGHYDADSDHSSGVFDAALFDAGGFYVGEGTTWTLLPDDAADTPGHIYLSRVSDSAVAISSIVNALPVPEPGGAILMLAAAAFSALLRRRPQGCRG